MKAMESHYADYYWRHDGRADCIFCNQEVNEGSAFDSSGGEYGPAVVCDPCLIKLAKEVKKRRTP